MGAAAAVRDTSLSPLPPLFPAAIAGFDLSPYDLVVSTSHCVAKSVIPAVRTASVLLLLADAVCVGPIRRVDWSGAGGISGEPARLSADHDAHGAVGRGHGVARTASSPSRVTFPGGLPDTIIARRRWVYPPVDTTFYRPAAVTRRESFPDLSALVPYKRIDLAIDACRRAGARLRIVGDGPERARLERLGGGEVAFLGPLSNEAIRDEYHRARRSSCRARRISASLRSKRRPAAGRWWRSRAAAHSRR